MSTLWKNLHHKEETNYSTRIYTLDYLQKAKLEVSSWQKSHHSKQVLSQNSKNRCEINVCEYVCVKIEPSRSLLCSHREELTVKQKTTALLK